MNTQTPGPGAWDRRCGTQRIENRTGNSIVHYLSIPSRTRPGILNYRAPRSPSEICAAITNALNREARLARLTGINTPPEVLTDLSAWVGRGCVP